VNLHNAGAWANIGSFFIGCLAVYLMWEAQQPTPTVGSSGVGPPGTINPAVWIFLFGLVGAGALHFAAVIIQGRQLRMSGRQNSGAGLQTKTDEASKASSVHPPERMWVGPNVTPVYLQGLGDARTTREAQKLEEGFIGKWMKLSGIVFDVEEYTSEPHVTRVDLQQPGIRWPVGLEFDEKWHGHIIALRVGDKINVLGQIQAVNRLGLHLHNCELI
jgi:hypothetical protein